MKASRGAPSHLPCDLAQSRALEPSPPRDRPSGRNRRARGDLDPSGLGKASSQIAGYVRPRGVALYSRPAWAALVVVLIGVRSLSWTGAAEGAPPIDSAPDYSAVADNLVTIDDSGVQVTAGGVTGSVDAANRTIVVSASAVRLSSSTVLVRKQWVRSIVKEPAFSQVVNLTKYAGDEWYSVVASEQHQAPLLAIRQFVPELGKAWYSLGSQASILLQRPMFISIAEIPHVDSGKVAVANSNGTWNEERQIVINRLGISFDDRDTSGQEVILNRTWMAGYVSGDVSFQSADGTPIANMSDAVSYHLFPSHFSVLYTFSSSRDNFQRASDQPHSNVYQDLVNRNVYILSDRRDPAGTNERLDSLPLATYDQTTSFVVRGTWTTSQQGNWQAAIPLFFMSSSNSQVEMANSLYVFYYSRDSNLGNLPLYYLRYRDSTGTLRMNVNGAVSANVQLEFEVNFNAYTRQMALYIYDTYGNTLVSGAYTLGASETFSVNKIGVASCSCTSPHTSEPTLIARADNLYLDAGKARNGGFEVDSNGDSVPDYWQAWIWSKGPVYRSSERAKYGTWSVKIADSSSSLDYGLQTERLLAGNPMQYRGSTWVYVSSGVNALCLEFWSSLSGGSRVGAACKNTVTTGQWEYLEITATAPVGTAAVDLLVYSTSANVGTGYFDGADLRWTRSTWSIEVHTNHIPDAATWRTALDYISDLGFTTIRIDFVWSQFEPSQDSIDSNLVAYWDTIMRMARSRGISVVANLAHVPDWAKTLRDCRGPPQDLICGEFGFGDLDAFYSEWWEFTDFIGYHYGAYVPYYQLLNEENHLVQGEFPHTHDGEPRAFYQAYQGLLAGTGQSAATHESVFKTVVNAFADDPTSDWNAWFRDVLNDGWGRDSIDIVAIDHYPGSWCCGVNYNDWGALNTLLGIARDYDKEMAIMETGFTTYGFNPVGNQHYQADQEAFVDQALPAIRSKQQSDGISYPLNALLLVSWYEFLDLDSGGGGWPLVENHWGILTYNSGVWGVKLAYDNLRNQIDSWS